MPLIALCCVPITVCLCIYLIRKSNSFKGGLK